MNQIKLPHWLQHVVATVGGGGLFIVAFLDSSVLTFPFVSDALVMDFAMKNPVRMPYYCAMAALGSLTGCIWLYLLAKKGGEAWYHRRGGHGSHQVKHWVLRNAFLSVFIPGILPPPFPFKVFVLAEGVFQVPLRTFVFALLCGRTLRYFVEGVLAIRYGGAVIPFLTAHKLLFVLSVLGVLAVLYFISRLIFRGQPASG
jgi:membrane protein YqaA with SNARE-associated domain